MSENNDDKIEKSEEDKDENIINEEEGQPESTVEKSEQKEGEAKGAEKGEKEEKEEEEEENKHKRKKPEKKILPKDMFYEYSEMVSQPTVTENSGIPIDVVKFSYSAGYDCHKRDNLVLIDSTRLCFISGNFLEFLNISDGSQHLLRSLSGNGIGCMAIHPTKEHIAVGEKCSTDNPMIAIYELSSLRLYRLLKEGTERAYAYCQFNTSGELLASVGSDPDYMLTVWEWENEQIVLRSKAFSQDVYRVVWSADLEGTLVTVGSGHIKFWKMADTFTGLKLQGHIGKFGKTEISDVEGFVILPDGKVLSGCEWGNLLVWDGDLIKVQIGKKKKKPCHGGVISQVIIEEGELMTVGKDGFIKTWDFETIDTAEVNEEMAVFEMEPMNEVCVDPKAQLMHIVKSSDSSIWYAQDANGKLWKLDLSFSHTSTPPQVVSTYHAGSIKDSDVSPLSYLSASIGSDGCVRIYDFASRSLLAEQSFSSNGSKILWTSLNIDPKGKMIICGFQDGVIRIIYFTEALEHNESKKTMFKGELSLIQALKPHTKPITALCTDDEGRILITGSKDESVFFFSISSPEYYPLGFVKLEKEIHHINWKPSVSDTDEPMGRILVYMSEGEVAEIVCPDPSKVDHSVTYEIPEIKPINLYKFVSIKSRLRHEEELEIKRKEEEERQIMLAKQRKERLERKLETEEEQQKQIEEEERRLAEEAALEEEWEPYIPELPSPILTGFVDNYNPNQFWLSMGDYDSGYMYKCEFPSEDKINKIRVPEKYNEAVETKGLDGSNDVPVTCMYWSRSGKRALMGFSNGVIRLQIVERPYDLSTMMVHWQFAMHDCDYGAVTSLKMSHDERFIISVGNDGNYFVYELMTEELQMMSIEEYRARLPSITLPIAKGVAEDIEDPNAYSIEEHKQKSEYDRKVKLAQEKKAETLKKISELQKEFKNLKDLNEKLPERIRLSQSVFELVPQLRADLKKMKDEKINLLHKQMAFESEKSRLALEKLRSRFIDPLESDHLEVHAIESKHTVCTIRGCKLSKEYYEVYEMIKIKLEQRRTEGQELIDLDKDHDLKKGGTDLTKTDDGLLSYNLKGARGMRVARQLKKLEDNKRKRTLRKSQWDALYAAKPKENYVDPRDIKEIETFKAESGYFQLKSSADYQITDERDRPTTINARSQLTEIENVIYMKRLDFNNKVKDLIQEKTYIIEAVKKTNEQIKLCNNLPGEKPRKPLPEIILNPSENPDRKFQYTHQTLLDFKKEMDDRKKALLQGEESGKNAFPKTTLHESTGKPKTMRPAHASHNPPPTESKQTDSLESMNILISELQKEQRMEERFRTVCSTERMIENTKRRICIFDMRLRLLRYERGKLSLLLKRALMRQLTVFDEYRLLKLYEKSESNLTEKAESKRNEKNDISRKLQEYQTKIDNKKKDIEKLIERDKLNFEKFKESLGDTNKFADYLTKVYKKKIKRRKKEAVGDDDDSEESSSSDDSDLDDSEENSDEDSVVYDLDMCPQGCSQELYESTCNLREIRLDIEEELVEERRELDALKREQESMTRKLNSAEAALTQAKKELEAFQLEKQQKLNVLKTCVILSMQQILYHENGQLPANLDSALVFEASNYRGLKDSIHRLKRKENEALNNGKDVKFHHSKLHRNKKLFQTKIADTQDECDQMMKTKFGKLDNLEKMEQVMINPRIEELTFKMLELQEGMFLEQSKWEDKIREAQELCIGETKMNTCILNNMLHLYKDKEGLEEKLDSKQKDLGTEFQLTGPKSEEEIIKLKELVDLQAQELEALKEEISMLSRKGGHILPPVASSCGNQNQSNLNMFSRPGMLNENNADAEDQESEDEDEMEDADEEEDEDEVEEEEEEEEYRQTATVS